ncbi:MAG: hypothetical protein JWR73_1489 [Tardiphaga sp.]|nr:hypothetical protein [Tardiphaga sp.]
MPTSNRTSHDDLISHLIAALQAARSLRIDAVEKLVRMSLIELGQSIANGPTQRPKRRPNNAPEPGPAGAGCDPTAQKPGKIKLPQPKTAFAPRELLLVADIDREMPDASGPARNDAVIRQRPPDYPTIPRRRLPPRRTGSRG